MKATWTKQALNTYLRVLDYLEEEWGQQCVKDFAAETEATIKAILEKPKMFPAGKKGQDIRKGLVTKHNFLIYRIKPNKKEIQLLLFWDTRQDSTKLKY